MKRFVWSHALVSALVVAGASLASPRAQAEDDPFGLKIANAVSKDRFFVHMGGIYVKVRTKSGDTYDVTGPVFTKDELIRDFSLTRLSSGLYDKGTPAVITPEGKLGLAALQVPASTLPNRVAAVQRGIYDSVRTMTGVGLLLKDMDEAGIDSIGTPRGVKAEAAHEMATAGFSLGFYFSDEQTWVAEAYVLAAPLRTSAVGRGRTFSPERIPTGENEPGVAIDRPLGVDGQKLVNTKLLPPTLLLGRYWGDKANKFRPYTGVLATYAIFYDTQATDFLNNYVGGQHPGDTTASIKNTFGMGPIVGFKYQATDDWHVSFNVGYARLRTESTIATRNTLFTSQTGAIYDLGSVVSGDIYTANNNPQVDTANVRLNGGIAGVVSRVVAANRPSGQNLGTYVRKVDLTLDNTLFMLSVGRSF